MNGKKKLFLTIIAILMVAVLAMFAIACSSKKQPEEETEDPDNYEQNVEKLGPGAATQKIYDGLLAGSAEMHDADNYGVENVITFYASKILNYTVIYKANYKENPAESEIYINLFDNNSYSGRIVVYYGGSDLYIDFADGKHVISGFGSTMLFTTFYAVCQMIDITPKFYDQKYLAGMLFNTDNLNNISALLYDNNISYNKAGENGEVIEFVDIQGLTSFNDQITYFLDDLFDGIDDKFDILTEKFLDFRLSRLVQSRFSYIYVDKIEMDFSDSVVYETYWKISGKMQDSSEFWIEADIGHNDASEKLSEGSGYVKSRYKETNLGQNEFKGDILFPSISDTPYDMAIATDIDTSDNVKNRLNLRIFNALDTDFLSFYYNKGVAYVDAQGINNWLAGAIDITAFNLPRAYLDGLDLSKLINSAYSNLAKVILVFVERLSAGQGGKGNRELYDILIDNFYGEGSTVYYKITEELIMKVRGKDETMTQLLASILGVDEKLLNGYIGEDFFADSEIIIGYNLDTNVLSITMKQKGKELFIAELVRVDYNDVHIPVECNTVNYAVIKYPKYVTLQLNASLAVRNGQNTTDASKAFGTFIGDVSGKNTPYEISAKETVTISGTVTQSLADDTEYNFVNITVTSRIAKSGGNYDEKTLVSVCTNPYNREQLLIALYTPLGYVKKTVSTSKGEEEIMESYANEEGTYFYLNKSVIQQSFDKLLGDDNIFGNSNVIGILATVLSLEGISTIEKSEGWFLFSLVAHGSTDPVYQLIGIKNTTATVKARAFFDRVDDDVETNLYVEPIVAGLDSETFDSLYSDGSAWKEYTSVTIGKGLQMALTYDPESIEIVTGKEQYEPTAYLFGKKISYTVKIASKEGRYKIFGLNSIDVIIDPTVTNKVPDQISVRYDNNAIGNLPCEFLQFSDSNITLAGYNLAGFTELDDRYEKCTPSKVVIGKNAILSKTFDVYILVYNRNVLPVSNPDGGENDKLYVGAVPVIGIIEIDPYTYAMKKMANPEEYNPILEGIKNQNMLLKYNNVYGEKTETILDSETGQYVEKTTQLVHDRVGVTFGYLANMNLIWDYDFDSINWMGGPGYAYATIGNSGGTPITVAIKIIVSAQKVKHIKIRNNKDERYTDDNGKYTIDFLELDSYTIPSHSDADHTVEIHFETKDTQEVRSRILVLNRPDGLSDEEYFANYIEGSLHWDGADYIVNNPTIVSVSGNSNLFLGYEKGRVENKTTAEFNVPGVGSQTIDLRINVPSRYQSQKAEKTVTVATSCNTQGEVPQFTLSSVSVSPLKFSLDGNLYEPYVLDPYTPTDHLPNTVYLTVFKDYTTSKDADLLNGNNSVVKEYKVNWVTTDANGNELNLIEEKEEGCFGLKNPVVYMQDMVVYGKIGDRGHDTDGNLGYIWVKAIVRNDSSQLKQIKFDGVELSQINIEIDPYKPYQLPKRFEAQAESNTIISDGSDAEPIVWQVYSEDDDKWLPIVYDGDESYQTSYKDDRYLFSCDGGKYKIRYIYEGSSEAIKQSIEIEISVLRKKVAVVRDAETDMNMAYTNFGGQDPIVEYKDINGYDISSEILYQNLLKTYNCDENGNVSPLNVFFTDNVGKPYALPVVWKEVIEILPDGSQQKGVISLLEDAFVGEQTGRTMILQGTIGTGTINEQEINLKFSFEAHIIQKIILTKHTVARDKGAVSIDEVKEKDSYSEITFSNIQNNTLHFKINQPYALVNAKDEYASPYDYIEYLFKEIELVYVAGRATVNPVINFLGMSKDEFNANVLTGKADQKTQTEIRIDKLSQGSAVYSLQIEIETLLDSIIKEYKTQTLKAELFSETGEILAAEGYHLPDKLEIKCKNSGTVVYKVDQWNVAESSLSYFIGDEEEQNTDVKVKTIPQKLINVLQTNLNQPGKFNFSFDLPCPIDGETKIYMQVEIPLKNMREVNYNADDYTEMYSIVNGEIDVKNPYLYYVDNAYGFDTEKIPKQIYGKNVQNYFEETKVNKYTVAWEFIDKEARKKLSGDDAVAFSPDIFVVDKDEDIGNIRILIAKAQMFAYYDSTGEPQMQTLKLYLNVTRLQYKGIGYPDIENEDGEKTEVPLDIIKDEETERNSYIVVDPYEEKIVQTYGGQIILPRTVTIMFDYEGAGGERKSNRYTFEGVKYKLINKKGTRSDFIGDDGIYRINYNAYGHTMAGYEDMAVLQLVVCIPGAELPFSIRIVEREIKNVYIKNYIFDSDGRYIIDSEGEMQYRELRSVYFIDPYNTATFALPVDIEVEFAGTTEKMPLKVSSWKLIEDEEEKPLGTGTGFNYRKSGDVAYGFFRNIDGYGGANYHLRGGISFGSIDGTNKEDQFFDVFVVVLNRSLILDYETFYLYEDPLGGRLSDIPGTVHEGMFVDYDKYYEEFFADHNIEDVDKYSDWNTPVLPYVNWYTDGQTDAVVEYKGGFDKTIQGNLFNKDTDISFNVKLWGDYVDALYKDLVDSRIWDNLFTSGGSPLAMLGSPLIKELNKQKEKLEEEIILATYELLVEKYTTEQNAYAQYIGETGTIYKETVSKMPYGNTNEKIDIINELYKKLIKKATEDKTMDDIAVYNDWQKIYEEFIADDDMYNPEISTYRKLKAEAYKSLNNTVDTKYIDKVNASLFIYKNATKWDILYSRASFKERAVMEKLLSNATTPQAKSNALTIYINYNKNELGSVGETASAHIVAAELDINELFTQEYYFNMYLSTAFESDIDIDVAVNYYPLIQEYVQEALEEALENLRENKKSDSLETFVLAKINEYVNDKIPSVIDIDAGGQEKKVTTFVYSYNNFNDPDTDYSASYHRYWEDIYRHYKKAAEDIVDNLQGATATIRWQHALEAFERNNNVAGIAAMERAKDTLIAERGGNITEEQFIEEDYSKLLRYLKDELVADATEEMDYYYAEAEKDIDIILIDYIIYDSQSTYLSLLLTGQKSLEELFEEMYGDKVEYDEDNNAIVVKGPATKAFNVLSKMYTDLPFTAGKTGVKTLYNILKNGDGNTTPVTEVRNAAENLFNFYLGGAKAYDMLSANATSVKLTEDFVNNLYKAIKSSDGNFAEDQYVDYFEDENEYSEYAKYMVVKQLFDYYESINSSYKDTLNDFIKAAVRDNKAAGYEELCSYYDFCKTARDTLQLSISLTNSVNRMKQQAFIKYFKRFEAEAIELYSEETDKIKEKYFKESLMLNSYEIYYKLLEGGAIDMSHFDGKSQTCMDAAVDAVAQYYEGNSEISQIIAYAKENEGNNSYNYLRKYGLGFEFTERLENEFYFKVIENGLSGIKENLSQNTSETNISEYKVGEIFEYVAGNDMRYSGFARDIKIALNKEEDYKNAISAYTYLVSENREAYSTIVAGKAYDEVYSASESNAKLLDSVLQRYIPDNFDTYDNISTELKQKLLDMETVYYRNAYDSVLEDMATELVYQSLGAYSLNVSAEGRATEFINQLKGELGTTGYNSFLQAISVNSAGEDYTVAVSILSAYADIKVIEDVSTVISNAVKLPDEMSAEYAVSMGLSTAVSQRLKNIGGKSDTEIAVETYRIYLVLLKNLQTDRDEISLDYLKHKGDFEDTEIGFEREYIKKLIERFSYIEGVAYTLPAKRLQEYIEEMKQNLAYIYDIDIDEMIEDGEIDEEDEDIIEMINDLKTSIDERIVARLMLTSDYRHIKDSQEGEELKDYFKEKNNAVNKLLNLFEKNKIDDLNKPKTITGEDGVRFTIEDYSPASDDGRHIIAFDKKALKQLSESGAIDGNEQGVMVKAPVYIGNSTKISEGNPDSYYKVDSVDYWYIWVLVVHVDFNYGGSESTAITLDDVKRAESGEQVDKISNYADKITIDPLAPELPEKVHAFGKYSIMGTTENQNRYFDLGEIDITYSETFNNNIYGGQAEESRSYSIFYDVLGKKDPIEFPITAKYINCTIDTIYFEENNYSTSAVTETIGSSVYYNMRNSTRGVNVITIDPIVEGLLDTEKKEYIFPEIMRVSFVSNPEVKETFSDLVWEIVWGNSEESYKYSLAGATGINMRLKSYVRSMPDNTSRKISFDYARNKVTIAVVDINDETVSSQEYNGVPSADIWNIVFDRVERSAQKLIDASTETVIGSISADGKYIDIDSYKVNPYDLQYPKNFKIQFKNTLSSQEKMSDLIVQGNWEISAQKLLQIILNKAEDRYFMGTITYCGYSIAVRFEADSLKFEEKTADSYYDGGVLYIVKDGGSAREQLMRNYSYFYYDFANNTGNSGAQDYRRVPVYYDESDVRDINVSVASSTGTKIKATLGWSVDLQLKTNQEKGSNIEFTVIVVDPQIYAKNPDGSYNKFAINDNISVPYDNNYKRVGTYLEPFYGSDKIVYFVGSETEFKLNMNTLTVDSYNFTSTPNTITYQCEFPISGEQASKGKLRFIGPKNEITETMFFTFTRPISGYLYTDMDGQRVSFDKKGFSSHKWEWITDTSKTDNLDTISWKLGERLYASDLPKVITPSEKVVSLWWDLDGINVNLATDSDDYYVLSGYYYSENGTWTEMKLAVIIKKEEISGAVKKAVNLRTGEDTITIDYNGRHYKLPLDLDAEIMKVLRSNGVSGSLSSDAVIIQYKREDEGEVSYSTDNYPINAGRYNIRIIINDENVYVKDLVLNLEIKAIEISAKDLVFEDIEYIYDGSVKSVVVKSGLPEVLVDNWFSTEAEKSQIYNSALNALKGTPYEGNVTVARANAYLILYNRVTDATKNYLDGLENELKKTIKDETNRRARMFENLKPNLKIVEVVATITYTDRETGSVAIPVDAGTYSAMYEIKASANNGNYYMSKGGAAWWEVTILRREPIYSILEPEMEYNGRLQDPYITSLHDENGNLPEHVNVTYSYKDDNGIWSYAGIKNIGHYVCYIHIDGGKNFISADIEEDVYIRAKNLFIEINDVSGEYLSDIISPTVKFNGIAIGDKESMFGYANVYTEAQSYYAPGKYDIFFEGFSLAKDAVSMYTQLTEPDADEYKEDYYRVFVKQMDDVSGWEVRYNELVKLFGTEYINGNYNVYVTKRGTYSISVQTDENEKIIIVKNNEELETAIDNIADNEQVKIFLSAKEVDNGSSGKVFEKMTYDRITLKKNANVSIIGCYDADKNILTYLSGVNIVNGSVTFRIVAFEAETEGHVSISVGKGAGHINVYEALFDGTGRVQSVGIYIDNGYKSKILVDSSTFIKCGQGIMAYGGELEITACEFNGNTDGIHLEIVGGGSQVSGKTVVINVCEFNTNEIGIYSETTSVEIKNNTFSHNRVAIKMPGGDDESLRYENEFIIIGNGANFEGGEINTIITE